MSSLVVCDLLAAASMSTTPLFRMTNASGAEAASPGRIGSTSGSAALTWVGPAYVMPTAKNSAELLALFDKSVAKFKENLAKTENDAMMKQWSLLAGGKPMFSMPRAAVIRGMILNHLVHHRGQLTVYLRMNDVPVPALYGPSADDKQFR